MFFDIDTKAGEPVSENSKYEHAAVATHHFTDVHGKQFFTLCHWNQDWIVSATALMESADNLSENRQGEIFHRIGKNWRQVGDRRDSQSNDLKTIISQDANLQMKITTGSND